MATQAQIGCRWCDSSETVRLVDDVEHHDGHVAVEVYQCPSCTRRIALICEPAGGLSPADTSWVEQEVAKRGSWFPSDAGATGIAAPRRRRW